SCGSVTNIAGSVTTSCGSVTNVGGQATDFCDAVTNDGDTVAKRGASGSSAGTSRTDACDRGAGGEGHHAAAGTHGTSASARPTAHDDGATNMHEPAGSVRVQASPHSNDRVVRHRGGGKGSGRHAVGDDGGVAPTPATTRDRSRNPWENPGAEEIVRKVPSVGGHRHRSVGGRERAASW